MSQIIHKETEQFLSELLKTHSTIIIGEVHGVVENPLVLEEIVGLVGPVKFIALELPVSFNPIINNVKQNRDRILSSDEATQFLLEDGRLSNVHLDVYQRLNDLQIPLVCIDPVMGQWDQRDKGMAQNLTDFSHQYSDQSGVVICMVGNVHSKNEKFLLGYKDKDNNVQRSPYTPFASYIGKHLSIELKYSEGNFYNFKKQSFDKLPYDDQLEIVSENLVNIYLKDVNSIK